METIDALNFACGLSIGPIECKVQGDIIAGLDVECTISSDGPTILPTLVNKGVSIAHIRSVSFETPRGGLRFEPDPSLWRIYKMGFNVSSVSGVVSLSSSEREFFLRFPPYQWLPTSVRNMVYNDGTTFHKTRGHFESEWVCALIAPDERSLAFGVSGFDHAFVRIEVDSRNGILRIVYQMDGIEIEPGERHPLDPFTFREASNAFMALRSWARSAANNGFSRCRPIRLWCTWYSGYYDRIDQRALLENLARMKETMRGRIDCVQLDDGYQARLGDWLETNSKFPDGLDFVARSIADAGFLPGIWLAPFSCAKDCLLSKEHPDWLIRDKRGRPVPAGFVMGSRGPRMYWALDTTNPSAVSWLRSLFNRLYEMGFRVFKLDFLTAAAVPGIRHDKRATRCEAYRNGMRAIRDAMPDDALLLAGISPLFANAGIVDQQRIGPDTCYGKPVWRSLWQRLNNDRFTPGIYNNMAASLTRCFTDGILWSADCDAIISQGVDDNIHRLLQTVNCLAGSTQTIGHDFTKSHPSLPLLESFIDIKRDEIVVLDLSSGLFPAHLLLKAVLNGEQRVYYAIINTTDKMIRIHPKLCCRDSFEFWSNKYETIGPEIEIGIEPRSCKLYLLREPLELVQKTEVEN